jgi:hypothetical protein
VFEFKSLFEFICLIGFEIWKGFSFISPPSSFLSGPPLVVAQLGPRYFPPRSPFPFPPRAQPNPLTWPGCGPSPRPTGCSRRRAGPASHPRPWLGDGLGGRARPRASLPRAREPPQARTPMRPLPGLFKGHLAPPRELQNPSAAKP